MRTPYLVSQLKTLLDMARKYMADRLHKITLKHLRELFPSQEEHCQQPYSSLRPSSDTGKSSFDPWVAVEISLTHDIPIILPMALYYSNLRMELAEIMDLKISPAALRAIVLFRDSFIAKVNMYSGSGDGYFEVSSQCGHHTAHCSSADLSVQELAIRFFRDFDYDVFQQIYAEVDPDGVLDELCAGCLKKLTDLQRDFRDDVLWFGLPSMCNPSLRSWTQVRIAQAKADGTSVSESP